MFDIATQVGNHGLKEFHGMGVGRKFPDHIEDGGFQISAFTHLLGKLIKLRRCGKLPIEQKIGDFLKSAVFGEVINGIPSIVEVTTYSINFTDSTLSRNDPFKTFCIRLGIHS
jgi:hypothetical protein